MKRNPNISKSRNHRPQDAVVRPQLFIEVIEVVETRDTPFEDDDGSWGSRITKPPGKGWRVADSRRERHTTWRRLKSVPWAVQPSSNGWRRP